MTFEISKYSWEPPTSGAGSAFAEMPNEGGRKFHIAGMEMELRLLTGNVIFLNGLI
jgi:hypothetical protein